MKKLPLWQKEILNIIILLIVTPILVAIIVKYFLFVMKLFGVDTVSNA